MASDERARVDRLDYVVGQLQAALLAVKADLGQTKSRVQQIPFGYQPPSGGGGGVTIGLAYCPGGVPCATATGTVPNQIISPGNAGSCSVATSRTGATWDFTSVPATSVVFNDYLNSFGLGVHAANYALVYQDPSDSTWRVIGEVT